MKGILYFPLALLMLLYQSIVLAFSQIWANKVRGILTTLGILIGVAAVTAVIALITGMKQRVLDQFEAMGTNKIMISPHFPQGTHKMYSWRQIMFHPQDFDEMLEHCPSVARYTRIRHDNVSIVFGAKVDNDNVELLGVDPDWHEIEPRSVVLGRTISVLDDNARRPVCLINKALRDKLEMDRDPVGQYLQVDDNRMLVVGMLDEPPAILGDEDVGQVVVPFNYSIEQSSFPWYSAVATAKNPHVADDAKAEIEFYLRQIRHIQPGDPDTFQVTTAQQQLAQFNKLAAMVTMIATGIVGISLLVGGVGIMNIMLVSVSERTREIGLRKAVGARPAAILLQFLVEAVVLCLIGGALGLVLGQMLTTFVASFLPAEAKITHITVPPSAILLAFTFSAGVGLLFGMFPAVKASQLDPIEALRHE